MWYAEYTVDGMTTRMGVPNVDDVFGVVREVNAGHPEATRVSVYEGGTGELGTGVLAYGAPVDD